MAIKPEPTDPVLPTASAPLHPNPTSTSRAHPKAPESASTPELKKERDAALKALSEHRRATAWAVGRWPVEKHVVHARTRVHLPRTYLARQGSDVRAVWPGADINQLVHRHYCEEVGKDGRRLEDEGVEKTGEREQDREKEREREKGREPWPNYVASERIRPRRHEYLGPDPRVVGYFVDAAGEYHVRWYDTFLGDQWMDGRKWAFDVRRDPESGRWVDVYEW